MTLPVTRSLVYYTDNTPAPPIFAACQAQLRRCLEVHDCELVVVSQRPLRIGAPCETDIVLPLERSVLSMFRQMLRGLEACSGEVVFLIEHDVLYHPSHFEFAPALSDVFYYNRNMWHVSAGEGSLDGKAVYYLHNDPSHLCAYRELLLDHYRKVVAAVEAEGYHSRWGFSPPRGLPPEQQCGHYATYMSAVPNIDIRHPGAFTRQRMTRDQFRSPNSCRGWTEADGVPGWGRTRGRMAEFLGELAEGAHSEVAR